MFKHGDTGPGNLRYDPINQQVKCEELYATLCCFYLLEEVVNQHQQEAPRPKNPIDLQAWLVEIKEVISEAHYDVLTLHTSYLWFSAFNCVLFKRINRNMNRWWWKQNSTCFWIQRNWWLWDKIILPIQLACLLRDNDHYQSHLPLTKTIDLRTTFLVRLVTRHDKSNC